MEKIRRKAQEALNALDCPDGELSIVITDDPQITHLNREYLDRNKPTNVIAFPMQEGEFSQISPNLLGDVVISMETADREAQAGEMSLWERFDQLLVHGILHLFGYDHEKNPEDAAVMENKSIELLNRILSL